MAKIYRLVFDRHRRSEDADRQTASLAGLAVTLLVLVVCMWLTKQLAAKSVIEDCLMAGRNNCDILVARLK
jgi:hypothetical protein